MAVYSLQNKIWNLPDWSTILLKFIYDKEGNIAGPTQILPVRVCGLALMLKTVSITLFGNESDGGNVVKFYQQKLWKIHQSKALH